MPYKILSDTTLLRMRKLELIEHVRCIEHNYLALQEMYNTATSNTRIIVANLERQVKVLEELLHETRH